MSFSKNEYKERLKKVQSSKQKNLASIDCFVCEIHGARLNGMVIGAIIQNYGIKIN